ncbi:MAG: hypothetical protein LKF87_03745 [Clostridium tyrobutyricum]|uniref:hypothetical protein n=1 Tax=Clostridium tyrobutyricum TaxID=1519 RepID=UPI002432BC7E|nr:hypothetical protein [Clostridium tyrobutyricum]MCH4199284.1 hypothetical protein [Clostridium tyrobutyricum]MCH4236616.1 hypothetical protein [Clostridium tyrobutyricum]MCH4258068.1 hypothetical protein [Clostridium tyrobutyricum]MCI1239107.1 hypothetical protein [Clostridium tyrobutyricum]MCI1651421.1 hypothetical protein [Clostridium tyrobutyricum]
MSSENEMADLVSIIHGNSREIAGKVAGNTGFSMTLGTITATGLMIDNFRYEITDYMVLDYLTMNKEYFTDTNTAGEDSHSHKVKTPDELKPLNVGDRVVVATIGAQNIIIGRVKVNA